LKDAASSKFLARKLETEEQRVLSVFVLILSEVSLS